jgi:4-hydroxyacetophenone monooxygenase
VYVVGSFPRRPCIPLTTTQDWANLAGSRGQLPRIKLRHSVVRADWDTKRSLYVIQIRNLAKNQVKTIEASILITASGGLSTPRYIELPGKENFDGKVIHAGDWPRDLSVDDLRGKTVVVVGNGCSG